MTIKINVKPNEESNIAFGLSLKGLNKEVVIPNSLTWTLTDNKKNPINGKVDIAETPAAETWVLLEGDDLAIPTVGVERIITFKGTFNSSLGGVAKLNVPYTEERKFDIKKILNVKQP